MYASSISAGLITRYTAAAATAIQRGRPRAERRGDRRASATVTRGGALRNAAPLGVSRQVTSAPQAANCRPQYAPGISSHSSTTRR